MMCLHLKALHPIQLGQTCQSEASQRSYHNSCGGSAQMLTHSLTNTNVETTVHGHEGGCVERAKMTPSHAV